MQHATDPNPFHGHLLPTLEMVGHNVRQASDEGGVVVGRGTARNPLSSHLQAKIRDVVITSSRVGDTGPQGSGSWKEKLEKKRRKCLEIGNPCNFIIFKFFK